MRMSRCSVQRESKGLAKEEGGCELAELQHGTHFWQPQDGAHRSREALKQGALDGMTHVRSDNGQRDRTWLASYIYLIL